MQSYSKIIWKILKHFTTQFLQAQTLYFWSIDLRSLYTQTYTIYIITIYTLNDLVKEQLHISKVELIGENFFPLAEKLFHVYPIKLWLSKMLLLVLARSLASQKVRKGRVKYGLYCPLFYSCRPHHAFYTQGTSWAKNYKMLQLYFSYCQ